MHCGTFPSCASAASENVYESKPFAASRGLRGDGEVHDSILKLQRLVLEQIAARRPADEILDQLCLLVQQVVPHGLATVMLLDPRRDRLVFRNAPGVSAETLAAFGELTPGPLAGSCGVAAHERRLVAVEDTLTDARWQSLRHIAEQHGIAACWSVPIIVSERDVAGTFAISRTVPGSPTEEQRELLEIAGYLGGVVLRIEREDALLRDQNVLLRGIVECTEDAVFVKDLGGRYLLANEAKARSIGKDVDDLIGKTDTELGTPDPHVNAQQADRVVIEQRRSVVQEVEFCTAADGRSRHLLVRQDPLRGVDDEVVGVVGIARDITDHRRVERAMQQAQKLESLGVLAGGIAHDFNNLLVGVLANVSLLENAQHISADELRGVLAEIRRASERAADLTNQLLQYAGKRTPSRTAVDVPELLRETPALLAGSVPKNTRVQIDVDEGLPQLAGDPVQLRQVVMNLVMNAVESLADGDGAVRIRAQLCADCRPPGKLPPGGCEQRRDWLRIDVRDDGCGMDEQTAARIFDPFYTTKATGRGLGLAAVLGIVSSHGGCLEVESQPGEGTTFRIWLPADAAAAEQPPCAPPVPVAGRGASVLVVEDERVVGTVLCRVLERSGYQPQLVARGDDGLRAFDQAGDKPFDVVIVDYTMPGIGGNSLVQRLRERDKGVPIVLTSGLAESDVCAGGVKAGADAFLSKPFTADQVLAAVAQARRAHASAG